MNMLTIAIFRQGTYTWLAQTTIQITHLVEKLLLIHLRINISSIILVSNNVGNSDTTKLLDKSWNDSQHQFVLHHHAVWGTMTVRCQRATALCLAGIKIPMTCCPSSTGTAGCSHAVVCSMSPSNGTRLNLT